MEQTTYRVLRDSRLARDLKDLHGGACQLCGDSICLPSGNTYSEAHHLIPLGRPHNGPDVAGNIVVLCPNHHVKLDYGLIPLSRERLSERAGHTVNEASIDYHNQEIFEPEQSPT